MNFYITTVYVYSFIKNLTMNLIKKIHYLFIYLSIRRKKIEKRHAQVLAEQYIYFYYKN